MLESVTLTHERLVLISSDGGSADELLRRPLVVFPKGCSYRQRLEEIQAKWGVVSNEIVEMNSLGAIFASVSAGLGVSLFPRSTLDALPACRQIHAVELPFEQADIPVSIIYRKEGHVRSAIRAMAQCFLQMSRDI